MNNESNSFYKVFCKYKAEILSLIIYVLGVSVISYFHEPWFDEAQAWQIARCSSLKDLILTVPHDEGHPPLWHLILYPFAKIGVPYLLTIKSINILFCVAAVSILIFKSPFPKPVRCLLPFSYFLFYQYGVVSRPYSMMMLAFFLIAITYKKRDEKPLPYILSLAFLCLTQLYGIMLAGMFCVVWVVKIFCGYKDKDKKDILKDKRLYMLLALLILALILIYLVLPEGDTYNKTRGIKLINRLRYTYFLLIIPFDAFFGMFLSYEAVPMFTTTIISIIFDCIGGLAVMAFLFFYGKKTKMLSEFFVPAAAYLIFASYVYLSVHHVGLFTLLVIYYFWINIEKNGTEFFSDIYNKIKNKVESKLIKRIIAVVSALVLMLPFAETIYCSIFDIKMPYTYSSGIANYIKEHNLEDMKIMSEWGYVIDLNDLSDKEIKNLTFKQMKEHRVDYPYMMGVATEISPYFDKNIVMNFAFDHKGCAYTIHKKTEDTDALFAEWSKLGMPDIIISEVELELIYDKKEIDKYEYVRIAVFESRMVFKFNVYDREINLYMRKDLLEDHPDIQELPF